MLTLYPRRANEFWPPGVGVRSATPSAKFQTQVAHAPDSIALTIRQVTIRPE